MSTTVTFMIPTPLTPYTSEELMREIKRRNDITLVGNWFFNRHIIELCGATPEEADAFLEECDPQENDAVLENAKLGLQEVYDTWKEEREQECE